MTPSMSRPASRSGLTGKPRASRRARAADWLSTAAGSLRAAGVRLLEQRRLRRRHILQQLVQPRGELATRRDRRILLAEAAGAAVARVRVQGQALLLALGVDPGELRLGHEDLAAGLEGRGLREALRDGPDRAQVGGHVLAGGPVAARGAQREPAALVAQRDGKAVDLELRDVGQAFGGLRCRRQPQALADAGVEGAQLVMAERVGEAEHRVSVADLRELPAGRRPAHALRRRVRGDKCGKRRLEGDQLAEQRRRTRHR